MDCSPVFKEALFAVYVVSIVTALANPAGYDYDDAYTLAQGANVTTLLLYTYCTLSKSTGVVAAVLGAALALRATDLWRGGTRWDSLLVTIGLLVNLQKLFMYVVPTGVPHKAMLYLAFSCLVMPVLTALPHLTKGPSVDDETIRTAADQSGQAYGITSTSSDALGGPMWTFFDKGTDTKAGMSRVVTASGKIGVYVYFAGSESKRNWQTNVNILGDQVPKDWCGLEGLRVHKGFLKAFESVSEQLLQAFDAFVLPKSSEPIVVTGHSLGAALATIAGLYIACKFPQYRDRLSVVTFGGPNVGDGQFVKAFDELVARSVRVVTPLDPLVRVLSPQLAPVKGYYPVGTLSLDLLTKAHNLTTYKAAVGHGRTARVVYAYWPAVVAGLAIQVYILKHL